MPESKKRKIQKKPNLSKIQRRVVEYIKNLEMENKEMKTNPEGIVGQIIPQLREAISQNKRLSVLVASLIEAAGGSITVSKNSLESFESKVLNIKWAVPEGTENANSAVEFVFTYEAVSPEEAALVAPEVRVTPNAGMESAILELGEPELLPST